MAIRIHRRVESTTLEIPELKPMIGRTVEIIVREEAVPEVRPGTGNWSAWEQAAADLEGYDFEAWRRQRECDEQQAGNRLP